MTKPDHSLSDGEGGKMKLTFEPHNGYGRKDPDGEPWPFGYLSEGDGLPSPVFELTPVLQRPYEELLAFARLFEAAPDLLEALKAIDYACFRYTGEDQDQIVSDAYDKLQAAIAKAEAAS